MSSDHMQIGEVAERVGLSLRTIRYYEEIGLIEPSARTAGGFRLYAEADADRLTMIKGLKPLNLSLDDTREVLELLDASDHPVQNRTDLVARLVAYRDLADERAFILREQAQHAEHLSRALRRQIRQHNTVASTR